jgi:hypothetical protein
MRIIAFRHDNRNTKPERKKSRWRTAISWLCQATTRRLLSSEAKIATPQSDVPAGSGTPERGGELAAEPLPVDSPKFARHVA